jgi:hypothetical protein
MTIPTPDMLTSPTLSLSKPVGPINKELPQRYYNSGIKFVILNQLPFWGVPLPSHIAKLRGQAIR